MSVKPKVRDGELDRILSAFMDRGIVETFLRQDGQVAYRVTESARRLQSESPELMSAIVNGSCAES